MRRASWSLLLLPLLLAGCWSPAGQLPEAYQVSDWELKQFGDWTDADAEARRLIGPEWGAVGYRPVRLGAPARKLLSPVSVMLGWTYEKRAYYVPDAAKYVFLRRGAPAAIVDEAWPEPGGSKETTPIEAWTRLRAQLERDMRALIHPRPTPLVEP